MAASIAPTPLQFEGLKSTGTVYERRPKDGMEPQGRWYRYEDEHLEDGRVLVHCVIYFVAKTTKAGVWLDRGKWSKPRFVLRDAHKRWACPTPEEAKASYRSRKKRQVGLLRSQLQMAENALDVPEDEYPVPKA